MATTATKTEEEGKPSVLWRSKLGHDYPWAEIERDEKKHLAELGRIRRMPDNQYCADCGDHNTVWASVNLGVFLCLRCGTHHRHMGTHVSRTKGCMGTYLWGPDEIANMKKIGNARARQMYGGDTQRPNKNASDDEMFRYIVDKYMHKKFQPDHTAVVAPSTPTTTSQKETALPDWEHFADQNSPVLRPAHHLSPTKFADQKHHKPVIPHAVHLDDWRSTSEEFFQAEESRQDGPPTSPNNVANPNQKDFFASFGL
jgi:hypothetical protein